MSERKSRRARVRRMYIYMRAHGNFARAIAPERFSGTLGFFFSKSNCMCI